MSSATEVKMFVTSNGFVVASSPAHVLTVSPRAKGARFVVFVPGTRGYHGTIVSARRACDVLERAGDALLASWVRSFAKGEAHA